MAIIVKLPRGLTLIELVIVMLLLSALGIMSSRYIATGVDIYSDVSERDNGLSSLRFAFERLRREVGNALPNSANVSSGSDCLIFTPIVAGSIYGSDFPIDTEGESGAIATISDYTFNSGDQAVVGLTSRDGLDNTESSDGQVHAIKSTSSIDSDGAINFAKGAVSFSNSSSEQRIYIVNDDISYYFDNDNQQLFTGSTCNDGTLIADNITGSFAVNVAGDGLHSSVDMSFILALSDQEIPFVQTVLINNVP